MHPSPLMHTHRTGPFRPPTALQMARVGVPASPWMWAKARSKLGALIRLCGDGVESNEARLGSFCNSIIVKIIHPFFTQKRTIPTHHCTAAAALRWRLRLAMDVGEGQK